MSDVIVTILTIAVLGFVIFLAIRKVVKDKRSGIGACGCKCSECPHSCPNKK
ncbi:MAG: FeoB-associated Cys-rich membrane protein [Eubacterium sp.]|nr:FeoB-associated Cys-rich membrane protein [Eubacterium sp.]